MVGQRVRRRWRWTAWVGRAWYYTQLNDCEAKAINASSKKMAPVENLAESPLNAMTIKVSLSAIERRIVAALAGIYATRMLGLFLLLPVLSIYATQLPDSSPGLIGVAMGAYGLTQAVFQIPFGRWSDHYGRRPVIAIGLLLFLLGSVVGALAESLWSCAARSLRTLARCRQQSPLLADFTREAVRTRAMASWHQYRRLLYHLLVPRPCRGRHWRAGDFLGDGPAAIWDFSRLRCRAWRGLSIGARIPTLRGALAGVALVFRWRVWPALHPYGHLSLGPAGIAQ
jgi:hypothetical protein